MAKIYKVTPVDELPGRRAKDRRSMYLDVLDEVARTGSRVVKVEISGRKPASITAGLKEAIARDASRYGAFAVHQRGGEVFLERRETVVRPGREQAA